MNHPFIVEDPLALSDVASGIIAIPSRERNIPRRSNGRVQRTAGYSALPPIRSADELLADETIKVPSEVVAGFLHLGSKGVLGAPPKIGKTWLLIDLAVSVASGLPWLGLPTTRGRVLLVNFEIQQHHIRNRLRLVANAKTAAMDNPTLIALNLLDVWTLRGHASPFTELLPIMAERVKNASYSLIIIDPIYKGMGGMNENDAGDIGMLLNAFEHLAVESGAAVVYVHHFAKGNQAAKSPIDRLSGSGVFGRDADSLLLLSELKPEGCGCYGTDMILRNHPPQPQIAVQWDFPIMRLRPDLDPNNLKGSSGAPLAATPEEVIDLLEEEPLTHTEWKTRAEEELAISASTFGRRLKDLLESQRIELIGEKYQIKKTEETVEVPPVSPIHAPASPVDPRASMAAKIAAIPRSEKEAKPARKKTTAR
jgi:hypothetical protein